MITLEEKKEEIKLKPLAKDIASWTRMTHYDIHKMFTVEELANHMSKEGNEHIFNELSKAYERYGRGPSIPISLMEGIKDLLRASISQKE